MIPALPDRISVKMKNVKRPAFRLFKALYGRTGSGYDWAERLKEVLAELGFSRCSAISGIFYKLRGSTPQEGIPPADFRIDEDIHPAVYVDGCLVAASEVAAPIFFKAL